MSRVREAVQVAFGYTLYGVIFAVQFVHANVRALFEKKA